jgi:hypothetical protein
MINDIFIQYLQNQYEFLKLHHGQISTILYNDIKCLAESHWDLEQKEKSGMLAVYCLNFFILLLVNFLAFFLIFKNFDI